MDELRLKGRRPKGRRKFMWEILTAKMCVCMCVQNVTQASQKMLWRKTFSWFLLTSFLWSSKKKLKLPLSLFPSSQKIYFMTLFFWFIKVFYVAVFEEMNLCLSLTSVLQINAHQQKLLSGTNLESILVKRRNFSNFNTWRDYRISIIKFKLCFFASPDFSSVFKIFILLLLIMTARFSFSMAINEREKEWENHWRRAVPKQFIINDIIIIKTSEGALFFVSGKRKVFHFSC